MANYYTQFSETLALESPEEVAWVREQFDDVFHEKLEAECPRFMLDFPDLEDYGYGDAGFNYDLPADSESKTYMWINSGCESGEPERVAHFVQKYLQKFHPDKSWAMTFANTCDKLRVGEFDGGAVFVTATHIVWSRGWMFIEKCRKAVEAGQPVSDEPGDAA